MSERFTPLKLAQITVLTAKWIYCLMYHEIRENAKVKGVGNCAGGGHPFDSCDSSLHGPLPDRVAKETKTETARSTQGSEAGGMKGAQGGRGRRPELSGLKAHRAKKLISAPLLSN